MPGSFEALFAELDRRYGLSLVPRVRIGAVTAAASATSYSVRLPGETTDRSGVPSVTAFPPAVGQLVRVEFVADHPTIVDVIGAPDPWHTVGGGGEPAFANTWANTGGSNRKAGFRRTADGTVQLAGWIKSTGAEGTNSTIFTLPVGYRPDANVRFDGTAGNSGGTQVVSQMTVSTAGLVVMVSPAATWGNVGLEVIQFSLVGPA